jgi:hypothetical protein
MRLTLIAAVAVMLLNACATHLPDLAHPRAEHAGRSADGKPQWEIECANQDEHRPECKAAIAVACPQGYYISGYTDQVVTIANGPPQRRFLYFVCGAATPEHLSNPTGDRIALSATRLFEEARAAGYGGGYTQVKDYAMRWVPLHPEIAS